MEGLNELLLQISNELGVGIDFLKSNFMESLPEIGRYLLVNKLVSEILFSSIFGVIIALIIMFAISIINDNRTYDNQIGFIKPMTISFAITVILGISMTLVPYLVSPKFWTIQKLLEMVR